MFAPLFTRSVRHFHSQKPVGRLLLCYKPPQVQTSNTTPENKQAQRAYQVDHSKMSDSQILSLLEGGEIQQHKLESQLKDTFRAVKLRRQFFAKQILSNTQHNFEMEN